MKNVVRKHYGKHKCNRTAASECGRAAAVLTLRQFLLLRLWTTFLYREAS